MTAKTITDLEGVFATGIHAGIKSEGTKRDMAFIYVPGAVGSAGVFTQNKFRAPCLDYTKRCLERGIIKAVIVNSGNANAATGEQGLRNAEQTAEWAAPKLGLTPDEIAVASTGIIGVQLPMERIHGGIEKLLQHTKLRDGHAAADAITTTDSYTKEVFVSAEIAGHQVSIAGIAKGAGMIAPNMGTMLCYLVTDAHLPSPVLQRALEEAVADSFNMISVDTDTSTNDMALLFATGKQQIQASTTVFVQFRDLLRSACIALAKMIARDGEGAEKLIEATVEGAATKQDARTIALNIINSPLIKTAIHGADPNWGRVIMAVGKDHRCQVDPKRIDLRFDTEGILQNGEQLPFDRARLVALLKQEHVKIYVNLHLGEGSATAWGCDLTMGYIKINTDYS